MRSVIIYIHVVLERGFGLKGQGNTSSSAAVKGGGRQTITKQRRTVIYNLSIDFNINSAAFNIYLPKINRARIS